MITGQPSRESQTGSQITRRAVMAAVLSAPLALTGQTSASKIIELPDQLEIRYKDQSITMTACDILAALRPIKEAPIVGRPPSRNRIFDDFVPNSIGPE